MQFFLTVVLLLVTLGASALTLTRKVAELAFPLKTIPSELAGWTQTESQQLDAKTLRALDATSYISRLYVKHGSPLSLFVSYYAQQRAGESMHSPKHCLPGSGWDIERYGSANVMVDGKLTAINRYTILNAGQRRIVYYWYQSGMRIVANEYSGKAFLIWDTLTNGNTAGAMVRIIVSDEPGLSEDGSAFATSIIPSVQHCLRKMN
jgi:EpsI family protein